jgi:hypothetical protein
MQQPSAALVLLGAALILAACGGQDTMSRPFGLARDAPGGDTTRVPLLPLSVPPNIGDRPLRPGASAIPTAASQPASPTLGANSGQQAFLDAAGGSTDTAAEIRQKIDDDARIVRPGPRFVSDLLSWTPPPGYATLFQAPQKSWWSRMF